MTGVTAASTSSALTPHQVWVRIRGLLLALLVLVAAGIALATVRSGDQHGLLDPRSADRYGSRAVAELLKDRGVSVRVVTTLDDATAALGPDTTLLVTSPNLLAPHQQHELRAATDGAVGRTVLLAAGPPSVRTLVPGVSAQSAGPVATRSPECSLPAARSAGDVETGGLGYSSDGLDTIGCFPSGGLPTVLLVEQGAGDTVLLGNPDLLRNDRLTNQGNASLALQLLGSRPHLVWYLPSLADAPAAAENGGAEGDGTSDDRSFADLIPQGWLWGTLQLALAAVLAAIWRARRLGPLVTERLPVAIRASESTEGRARLYRKANARDRAAESLRSATRTRLAPLIGVPPRDAHSPSTLVPAVSARLGSTDDSFQALLFGPAPSDDAALVRLADQLDTLEREVRTS
ncbi:DUF4350 domain-containing protein [Streptomyces sp. NBC_00257]|uniref:DUF4350 domain-containing protein n=1 Tax=unclassified Streptomyces TaxID=2593676 RepID=UPI002258E2AE|nr:MULTISPECIES: DUF4350 domain-containing protein [unclassified Streptomyces]WTB54680.1 DUF4350 domain-containing protein [Streptomyces sp. NBC_00826]WTH92433.1 DUF4350 domain-containing protein [Streptomyces sp. NBC_00825]WTI01163.1 DUF4350 domain-containing protein [Streptomyces sp. NBC_00822]MCX4866743.1 DUF4350 domain-containing protein [Streptomyces sp. NBC_00906]MCX4897981.1 DUF4350 domain-containing protein [Streptomyces sp. NBC_00892]